MTLEPPEYYVNLLCVHYMTDFKTYIFQMHENQRSPTQGMSPIPYKLALHFRT